MTADEREHLYAKKGVKRALEAKEFIKNAGCPSLKEAVHLAQDGNIIGLPQTAADISRYYDIYGPPVEAIRGMTTNKKVSNIIGTGASELREQHTKQELVMDIMFLAKERFLISIATPLELTIVSVVGSMTRESPGSLIQAQVTLLCSRAFEPYLIGLTHSQD